MKEVYGRESWAWKSSDSYRQDFRSEVVVEQFLTSLSLTKASVLDVGCGLGEVLDAALRKGASHVTGVDISHNALKENLVAGRSNSLLIKDSLPKLTNVCGHFDFVFCRNVLHLIPDLESCFARFVELLRAGGTLTIEAPIAKDKHEQQLWTTLEKRTPARIFRTQQDYLSAAMNVGFSQNIYISERIVTRVFANVADISMTYARFTIEK